MTKVQILTTCESCNGQAYLPSGEAEDWQGKTYTRFTPCPSCEGSGLQPKWVSLAEFAILLQQEQCSHQHTSFNGGFHLTAGDVWDDLTEVCNDCGANLDRP
jgi:hypothetical protein